MLVEDDPTMLSLLNTLLKIEGFEVVNLTELDTPIDLIKREMPDLVLIDVHLKHYNGFDLLNQIRNDERTRLIPVVMSSGMDFTQKAEVKGANAFILKPYMPDELIQIIHHQISG